MKIHACPLRILHDRVGSRGQALAEMAFVLPILLVLVFGIIEMSLAWRTSQIVTNVTREGARLAVLPTTDDDQVRTRIQTLLTASNLNATPTITTGCDVAPTDSICEGSGDQTLVQTEYPYQFRLLGPLVELAGGGGGRFGLVMISSTSTMRRE